ncbi:uncharacterized protein LOC130656830 [Hydractinia symbiolongicarpus]|uniref:uncharacterized protein LOC130656830 n=1 Tax=Hydractinia symbiolongicarpus TaxID=13093 RepID=UPI00254F7AE2|nr:uncharacterized protein LOC130656830 [Hydractinia symbiolongicarpus]XP_057315750.1 uncharacterized protein LOC130656830 [Hydractinia symbiolongicarpus]
MSCELFVGNLNPEVRMRDLENCFGRYGKIVRCDLKKNFGFIQFEDRRDAEEAIRKENNRTLLGSRMTVEWAKGSIGDKSRGGGGGAGFRKPHSSPPRFTGRGGRDRSPFAGGRMRSPVGGRGGRERSPVGRNGYSSSFSPREDRFSGGGPRRMSGGRDSFDSRSNFDSRPPRDRFPPRERFDSDRSRGPPMDRGNRGPPPRDGGFSDRGRDRFNDRRESFGERRSFGGGPRRF